MPETGLEVEVAIESCIVGLAWRDSNGENTCAYMGIVKPATSGTNKLAIGISLTVITIASIL